jgi:hypothetical protein
MDTAALTTMIHASRTRGDLKMITQQVAMYGDDKDNSTMNALALQAATTGTFQCDVAKTGCMRNDSEGLGVSLMRLFTEIMIACFDVDRQRSFEKLRKEFGDLDQSRCKTFSMAIATEMLSYDMCEGSYGGPFCTAYDQYLNMYRALEQHTLGVADAIADIIVETDDIDTLPMKWEDAKGLILRGFKRAAKYRQNDVKKI